MVRRGQMYDEDDLGDYDDDDYDDWDDAPAQPVKPAAGKSASSTAKGKQTPAAAAGASALARYLCDPHPPAPSGKLQPGAKKEPAAQAKQQQKYPVAPPPGFTAAPTTNKATSSGAAGQGSSSAAAPGKAPPPGFGASAGHAAAAAPFDFSTPSPDAQVLAAQARQGPGSSSQGAASSSGGGGSGSGGSAVPGFITLAPSKAMQAANQQLLAQAGAAGGGAAGPSGAGGCDGGGVAGLGRAVSGLSVGEGGGWEGAGQQGAGAPAGAHVSVAARRRISEYVMDPALSRECATLAAAEASGGGGGGGARAGLHLVVLGHVDAGKSTLMGRLLHDLGHVGAKEVHKNQRDAAAAGKASFSWAWLLDERPEERARGVTVDVATARFNTPRYNVTLLDAPGHKDFVPNMISGASQADAALLVVDGSPGGFEAGFEGSGSAHGGHGQTREHAQLARSLGVEQVAVVISKLDMAGYDPMRFADIQSQLAPFLASCGFKDSSVQWLPAVGPAGENLTQPPVRGTGLGEWWQGSTLVQAIDTFKPRERLTGKPLRLPVTDVYRNKAGVSVVGGKLEAGAIKAGTKLVVMPGGDAAVVKGVEVDGQPCALARAGDSVALQLVGGGTLDDGRLPSGAVLCNPDCPVPLVTKFEARLLILDVPVPLLPGRSVTVHAHVAREAGVVTALVASINSKTGETLKAKPRCLLKGQSGVVEVRLERPLCLEEYSDLKPLGRVALRDAGKTLAVGVVTRLLD